MRQTMILTGEINLKTVTDPMVPFGRVTKELGEADLVFANLECLLADPPAEYATNQTAFHTTSEGFYAGPVAGEALKLAGFDGVGCANNVTYGEDAIRASLARLKALGIPVTGAGLNRAEAHRPLSSRRAAYVLVSCSGRRSSGLAARLPVRSHREWPPWRRIRRISPGWRTEPASHRSS
jgi:hypothetical protein